MANSEPTVEDYIGWLTDPAADVRRNAAWMLGRLRDIRIVEPLIGAVQDTDPDVRMRVMEALGNIRDERVIEPLLTALHSEANPQVLAAAASALGRAGDLRALDPLVATLKHTDAVVRSAAAEALGALKDPQAAESLTHTLLSDSDSDTRYYASKSLVQIGGARVVDGLLAALSGDYAPEIKVPVIEILGQLYDQRAVDPLKPLAEDADEGVRETAKWALRQLGVK